MKNPLMKRIPREFKNEAGKYIVLFIFITSMIAIVSGFLVAGGSMAIAYDESFEKYNIEDGNFELADKADKTLIDTLEQENLSIYENFYIEEPVKEYDATLRIFGNRDSVNKVCLMEGELPVNSDEIAIDRMHADNNDISVGDTITAGNKTLKITGLVALSDYSALYQNPSDMMFDAIKFGVAVVTDSTFDSFGDNHLHYSYSWKYDTHPDNDKEAKEMSEDFLEVLSHNAIVTNFIPQYSNQAIHFTGDDIGGDKSMIAMFLYIVIIIISFIFAITTSNTIAKEASVIGTLRASGYTRSEIMIHYLSMPVLVTLLSAIIGNILGYTILKDFAANMYYHSYSLPTYVTIWNAEAFIKTTIIPVILMIAINIAILTSKLRLSPLKFIRHDLSRRQKKKAFRLNTKIGIMKRFRLRVIFQNMPNYITIIIGIFFANFIMLFGLGITPVLEKYQENITNNLICNYQYVLKAPVDTASGNAEKYAVTTLKTPEGKLKSEEVMIYGISNESKYFDISLEDDSIYISNAYAEKHNISTGDTITLEEEYSDGKYSFKVSGIYDYPSAIAVFMNRDYFNDTFEYDSNYFNGYFSNEKIADIDDMYIATTITEDDMTKTSRQLIHSMGNMIQIFTVFGIIMFMLIIYLLSKIIIEKNAQSVSMTKILGYTNSEINGLYIMTTTIVVIASLLFTIPVCNILMKYIFIIMFREYSGWMPYYVPFSVFIEMFLLGICAYAIIAFAQMNRIKKVPLTMALKNVE
ncbi:MAG: FtsX-like permease family protein [Coprococcus sp.]